MKQRNVGAGGKTDFVSGPVLEKNEMVAIHDLATVSWPTCRQHYGRLYPPLVQQERHILHSLPHKVGLRQQPKEVGPVLHRTVQSEVKRQDAICLRTVRVKFPVLFAFHVEMGVITPDHS